MEKQEKTDGAPPMEPVAPAPPAEVEQDIAMSAQVDTICRISRYALQRPRNEGLALQQTLQQVDETSWWRVSNRGEGASVNIARTALQRYGNAAVLPNIVDAGERWDITILAIDMESLAIMSSAGTLRKPERGINEKDLAYAQRCFQMQLAFAARLERNAIFKILPGHWKKQIEQKYRETQQAQPLTERATALMGHYGKIGVSMRHLKKKIGVDPEKMSEAQFGELRDLYNALHNGDTTIDEAFGIKTGAADLLLKKAIEILQSHAHEAGWTDSKLKAMLDATSGNFVTVAESLGVHPDEFKNLMEGEGDGTDSP